jgi:hypothetical protein
MINQSLAVFVLMQVGPERSQFSGRGVPECVSGYYWYIGHKK